MVHDVSGPEQSLDRMDGSFRQRRKHTAGTHVAIKINITQRELVYRPGCGEVNALVDYSVNRLS